MKPSGRSSAKPTPPKPERSASRAFALSPPFSYAAAAILLLVPCFWQSRIHAGDLSSHIYNAWLVQLIHAGKANGLIIVPQTTNVLVDYLLAGLLPAVGAGAAQRIAAALCVCGFFWGAFVFVRAASGSAAWPVVPALALLAYGWTFHMGFLNMYLSLGLCLFGMAAAWKPTPVRIAVAAGLLALAYVAHGLPVAWAIAVLLYRAVALRLGNQARLQLACLSLAAIVLARLALDLRTETRWQAWQFLSMTGADQAWIYDSKYWAVAGLLLASWLVWLSALSRAAPCRNLLFDGLIQIALLTAAGLVILPTAITIPGYSHLLTFISMRMSLAVGVCYCAVLATVRPPAVARWLAVAALLLHLGFLYRDGAILNGYEDRMTAAVAGLKDARVVIGLNDPSIRANPFTHMIDRACLGVCYSFGNYEPSTAQFRIRVTAENPMVASNYVDAWRLENGMYVVKPRDLPMYRVDLEPDGSMVARPLVAGERTGMTNWDLLR